MHDAVRAINRAKFGGGGVTEEDGTRMKLSGELLAKLKASPIEGKQAVVGAVDAGKMTKRQAQNVQKKSGMSRLEWDMNLLTAADAVSVYKEVPEATSSMLLFAAGSAMLLLRRDKSLILWTCQPSSASSPIQMAPNTFGRPTGTAMGPTSSPRLMPGQAATSAKTQFRLPHLKRRSS
jgi:hypothetical protein